MHSKTDPSCNREQTNASEKGNVDVDGHVEGKGLVLWSAPPKQYFINIKNVNTFFINIIANTSFPLQDLEDPYSHGNVNEKYNSLVL